jgi:hypothetical protein
MGTDPIVDKIGLGVGVVCVLFGLIGFVIGDNTNAVRFLGAGAVATVLAGIRLRGGRDRENGDA